MGKLKCRAAFISDLHLYSNMTNYESVLLFIKRLQCEHLYIVGDLIDLWVLKPRSLFGGRKEVEMTDDPTKAIRVLRALLKKAQKGTKVTYIPGNHDDYFRHFAGMDMLGFSIEERAIHETIDGRRFLVTHGDEFDSIVRTRRRVAILSTLAQEHLVLLNRIVNLVRRLLGRGDWSFAKEMSKQFAKAVTYATNFEALAIQAAKDAKCDGVICGHTHEIVGKEILGVKYYNCGDWTDKGSAIIEGVGGIMSVVKSSTHHS